MDHDRHIWQMKWVRDLVLLALLGVILGVAYEVRAIATPVVIALGLAYISNPLVTRLNRWKNVPRWATAGGLLLIVTSLVGGLAAWILPKLVNEAMQLASRSQAYLNVVERYLHERFDVNVDLSSFSNLFQKQVSQHLGDSGTSMIQPTVGAVGKGISIAADVATWLAGVISYIAVAAVIISICYVFFSWKWADVLQWFDQFIPRAKRDRVLHILGRMDRTVSGIIRGRFIQAGVMGVLLSLGWWLAGVPYWMLLGVLGGLLNLAPFAASLAWIAAVLLAVVAQQAGSVDISKSAAAQVNRPAQTAPASPPNDTGPAPASRSNQKAADQKSGQTPQTSQTSDGETSSSSSSGESESKTPSSPANAFTWWVLILPTLVYFGAQLLDGWVVEPLVQGQAADLGPVTVLLAVMIGGALAGALGLLLAIPVAACTKILCHEVLFPKFRRTVESMAEG